MNGLISFDWQEVIALTIVTITFAVFVIRIYRNATTKKVGCNSCGNVKPLSPPQPVIFKATKSGQRSVTLKKHP